MVLILSSDHNNVSDTINFREKKNSNKLQTDADTHKHKCITMQFYHNHVLMNAILKKISAPKESRQLLCIQNKFSKIIKDEMKLWPIKLSRDVQSCFAVSRRNKLYSMNGNLNAQQSKTWHNIVNLANTKHDSRQTRPTKCKQIITRLTKSQ